MRPCRFRTSSTSSGSARCCPGPPGIAATRPALHLHQLAGHGELRDTDSRPGDPPFSGTLFSDIDQTTPLTDLGLACLYIGGGNGRRRGRPACRRMRRPSSRRPMRSSCWRASAPDRRDCTKGPATTSHCLNNTAVRVHQRRRLLPRRTRAEPDANCYFGPPVPVERLPGELRRQHLRRRRQRHDQPGRHRRPTLSVQLASPGLHLDAQPDGVSTVHRQRVHLRPERRRSVRHEQHQHDEPRLPRRATAPTSPPCPST